MFIGIILIGCQHNFPEKVLWCLAYPHAESSNSTSGAKNTHPMLIYV